MLDSLPSTGSVLFFIGLVTCLIFPFGEESFLEPQLIEDFKFESVGPLC